jgi:LmbE family N-acetylglucosaminyl deacetylase
MNVVAHQDDDLLFMNPDIINDLKAGNCNRTVYVTAGDYGSRFGWLAREQGSEAAYAQMLGVKNPIWSERIVEVGDEQFVKVAGLRGNPRVSLIFMHLPDGNLTGSGFAETAHQSLEKLQNGTIHTLKTVDGQSTYTKSQLEAALLRLMEVFQASAVRTQSSAQSEQYPDHSDHRQVSFIAAQAWQQYQNLVGADTATIPLTHYEGYPSRTYPENVSGADLESKQAAFFAYAAYDPSVCSSVAQCASTPTYDSYLKHQIILED